MDRRHSIILVSNILVLNLINVIMTKLRIFMHSEIEKSSNTQNARTTYENISNALFIVIFNGRIKSLRNLNIFDRVLNDINEMNETNEIK